MDEQVEAVAVSSTRRSVLRKAAAVAVVAAVLAGAAIWFTGLGRVSDCTPYYGVWRRDWVETSPRVWHQVPERYSEITIHPDGRAEWRIHGGVEPLTWKPGRGGINLYHASEGSSVWRKGEFFGKATLSRDGLQRLLHVTSDGGEHVTTYHD